MFRRKKDEKVDISSLNEILVIGSKLTRIVYIAVIVAVVLLGIYVLRELKILALLKELDYLLKNEEILKKDYQEQITYYLNISKDTYHNLSKYNPTILKETYIKKM